VPGIPHEHDHGPTLMETMIKGQGEESVGKSRHFTPGRSERLRGQRSIPLSTTIALPR
jgi:hypothetical protein